MIYVFDYATLKLIWWLFVGVLLVGFALMDGFDLGIGTLLPFVGRTDDERRVMLNAVGPTWEGNQVWFITAGGATFAAWPLVYAAAFSGFYVALILTLFALFFRPVGFDYRSKLADPRWRSAWDWGLFVGGAVPALVFGVAFGNLLLGVPFHFDADLRVFYTGSFFGAAQSVRPAGRRGEPRDADDARRASTCSCAPKAPCADARGTRRAHRGHRLHRRLRRWRALDRDRHRRLPDHRRCRRRHRVRAAREDGRTRAGRLAAQLRPVSRGPSRPRSPAFGGALLALVASPRRRAVLAFVLSSRRRRRRRADRGVRALPVHHAVVQRPGSSLTVWDAVSSHRTLQIMFWAALIFLPLIVAYTAWVYRVMRGKITEQHVRESGHALY